MVIPVTSINGGMVKTDAAELRPPSPTNASTIGNSHARIENTPIAMLEVPSRFTALVELLLVSALIGLLFVKCGETSQ